MKIAKCDKETELTISPDFSSAPQLIKIKSYEINDNILGKS